MNQEATLPRDAAPIDLPPPARRSALPWAAALLFLIVLNGFMVLRWTRLDTRPAAWDESIHTLNTFEYRDRLATGSFFDVMKPVTFKYPPLFNFAALPFLGHTADIADLGALPNLLFLAGLIVITFKIGTLLMDRWAGLAAATVVSVYPLVFSIAHATMLDLALTTLVAAAFYALLKSENLARPGWSALFGFALGLGMLVKPTAAAYLVGPVLPVLVRCLLRRTWAGPAIAFVVFLATMAPWYGLNAVPILIRVGEVSHHPPAGGVTFTGWTKLFWYPVALFEQINLPFVLLFAVGLVTAAVKRTLGPVALWYFASAVIFGLVHNNNVRYLMPALPAVAVLSVSWTQGRRWAPGVVALVSAVFFGVFHFGNLSPIVVQVRGVPLPLLYPDPPLAQNWRHKEIIARVAETRDQDVAFSRVIVVANQPGFHSVSLNTDVAEQGIDNFSFAGPSKNRWLDFAEFVLVKTGDLGPAFTIGTVQKYADWLANPPAWFKASYKDVGRWSLPDGSEAILFHADPDPLSVSKDEMMSVTLHEVVLPGVVLHDVAIRAVAESPAATSRGRLSKLTARAGSVDYRGLLVENADVTLVRPQINLPRYKAEGELQIIALDRLEVHGTVRSKTLLALAGEKARWLSDPQALFNDDVVVLSGRLLGKVSVRVEARLDHDGETLQPRLQSVSLAGIPIPIFFVRVLTDLTVPLFPNKDWPYRIDLGAIKGTGDALTVGA